MHYIKRKLCFIWSVSNQYGFRSWFSRCFSSWLFWCLLQNFGCPMVLNQLSWFLKCPMVLNQLSWFLKTNGVYLRFLFNVSLTESSRFVRIFFMSWCDSAEDSVLIKVIYFCYASQHVCTSHHCKAYEVSKYIRICDMNWIDGKAKINYPFVLVSKYAWKSREALKRL